MAHLREWVTNLMTRHATAEDVNFVVDLIEDLVSAIDSPMRVERDAAAQTVASLINSDDGCVIIDGDGFIAGQITRTVISSSRVAVELGWISKSASGRRLLLAFETWAKSKGASLVAMSTGPKGPDLSRRGYRKTETTWVRSI